VRKVDKTRYGIIIWYEKNVMETGASGWKKQTFLLKIEEVVLSHKITPT
jgi:hypothetical protein